MNEHSRVHIISVSVMVISYDHGNQSEHKSVDFLKMTIDLVPNGQIAHVGGNISADLVELLSQSVKASLLLITREKISALTEKIIQAKQEVAKPLNTLTPSEREVLKWVQLGKTNPEIAQILGISRFTVKTHVQRIYSKLAMSSRVGLARLSSQ
jgi:DNA-binding CsgD family transcriptional regulator